ncbi:S4 domain-containing protein [Croceicoccus sp. F390]|uniref:S4 domain-containing protein n=1 Tax=Croceicoccus esteveae TaxID=3075597 RepID=A0ABU2ZIM8_9SPHN|nr:S4 domain-containing protein [Croceicoccus sp. F390]MDT0576226.1 S4 domain-containing protein [Croceicoccus sp. F390]
MNAPAAPTPGDADGKMRIDKVLWMLRLTKTRSAAQAQIQRGHARVNGRRVLRPAQAVGVGDILVCPLAGAVRVLEITQLPVRRGPPAEARLHYRELAIDPQPASDA